MSFRKNRQYEITEELNEHIRKISKEVIKHNPKDILDFIIKYFKALENKDKLSDDKTNDEHKESNVENSGRKTERNLGGDGNVKEEEEVKKENKEENTQENVTESKEISKDFVSDVLRKSICYVRSVCEDKLLYSNECDKVAEGMRSEGNSESNKGECREEREGDKEVNDPQKNTSDLESSFRTSGSGIVTQSKNYVNFIIDELIQKHNVN